MKKGVIKLYFTFENCIIKNLFVFYRTRNSSTHSFIEPSEKTSETVSSGSTNVCVGL